MRSDTPMPPYPLRRMARAAVCTMRSWVCSLRDGVSFMKRLRSRFMTVIIFAGQSPGSGVGNAVKCGRMKRRQPSPRRGFTMIELMAVVAVFAILAMLAVPTFRERIVRKQVAESLDSLEFVRTAIGARYAGSGIFPKDKDASGLPPAHKNL